MPWITCIWCSCHIISLFFKDCFGADKGVPSLVEALAKVKRVVHFIRGRQKPLGIYRSIAKKALVLPGETRYGSAVLTIMRFVTQIDACDEMFSCAEYKKWLKTQDRDVQSESAACRAIANDPAFGSFCAEIADFFDPAHDCSAQNWANVLFLFFPCLAPLGAPGPRPAPASRKAAADRNPARNLLEPKPPCPQPFSGRPGPERSAPPGPPRGQQKSGFRVRGTCYHRGDYGRIKRGVPQSAGGVGPTTRRRQAPGRRKAPRGW
jgi:hypothetical protein